METPAPGGNANRASARAGFCARRFRAKRFGGAARRGGLPAERARIFHLARSGALPDRGRDRPHAGLPVVCPELGSRVRLYGTSGGILRRAKANGKGARRTVAENGGTFGHPFRAG